MTLILPRLCHRSVCCLGVCPSFLFFLLNSHFYFIFLLHELVFFFLLSQLSLSPKKVSYCVLLFYSPLKKKKNKTPGIQNPFAADASMLRRFSWNLDKLIKVHFVNIRLLKSTVKSVSTEVNDLPKERSEYHSSLCLERDHLRPSYTFFFCCTCS